MWSCVPPVRGPCLNHTHVRSALNVFCISVKLSPRRTNTCQSTPDHFRVSSCCCRRFQDPILLTQTHLFQFHKPESNGVLTVTKIYGCSAVRDGQSTVEYIISEVNLKPAGCRRRGAETTAEWNPYHDGVAGSGGEVDVVGVGGDSAVPLLDVARHVLPDALDALARAVRPLGHVKT